VLVGKRSLEESREKILGTHEAAWGGEKRGDELRFTKDSVIEHQTRTREKYGVVNLHITHGIDDRVAFQEEQDLTNKNGRPYFVMCDEDLAGRVDLTREKPKLWHLWKMFGLGGQVFSQAEIFARPPGAMWVQQNRIKELQTNHVTVVPQIPDRSMRVPPWELHMRRYDGNPPAPPIKDIEVAVDAEQVARLARRGYEKVDTPLASFGGDFAGCVSVFVMVMRDQRARNVYSLRRAEGVCKTPGFGADAIAATYDGELEKAMEVAGLTEVEVKKLYLLFKRVDVCDNDEIWVDDLADWFSDQPEITNGWVKCLFGLVGGDAEYPLRFPQFAHLITTFCLFDRREMYSFMFNLVEHDAKGAMNIEQFKDMLDQLAYGSTVIKPGHVVRATRAFPRYCRGDANNTRMERAGFTTLLSHFPTLSWPCFQMQQNFQGQALGAHYWREKKARMMRARQLVDRETLAYKDAADKRHRLHRERLQRNIFHDISPEEEMLLRKALDEIDAKSRLAIKFKKHWKELPEEQRKDVIKTLKQMHNKQSREDLLKTVVNQAIELEKAEARAENMSVRDVQNLQTEKRARESGITEDMQKRGNRL